jgi:hypothetical protein
VLWRLVGVLPHFPFRLKEYGAVLCVVVCITVMVHAIQSLERVGASAMTAASAWHAPL